MRRYIAIACCIITVGCASKEEPVIDQSSQSQVVEKYLKNGAWNHHYLTKEWDEWISKGIEEDSTIAFLWQQKALPFWKRKKYALAVKYYDKAVELNRHKWLSRRGFLRCIFSKEYEGALSDLEAYRNEFGPTYEQDHPLEFYMGICHLQLNRFDKALEVLQGSVQAQESEYGLEGVHYLDRYYLAIAYYENGQYDQAIAEFDKTLEEYPVFSDAQYYKSLSLNYLGDKESAQSLMAEAKANFDAGHTFNEDSNPYEDYPYQITWQWSSAEAMLR